MADDAVETLSPDLPETEEIDAADGAVPFDSLEVMAESHTELLRRELSAGGEEQPNFLGDVREIIQRGRATGAILESLSERRTAQSLLNYWITVLYRAGDVEPPDAILVPFQEPKRLDLATVNYPYLGLNPFTEADHGRFYGRTGITGRLIKRLAENHLVILVGPAGSGKTSVINAGIIPELKSGKKLPGSEKWRYFKPITPGREPLKSLAALLATDDATPPAVGQEAGKLFSDKTELRRALEQKFSGQPTLTVVDRFEEVFTLCKDDAQRDAFIANLVNLLQTPEGSDINHQVILIVRSDRTNYIIQRDDLKELYPKAEIRIHPLRESDLREAIKEPARKIGLRFERGVAAQLIREIYGDQTGLPLLQFMLLKLWEEKQGDTITWAALNRLVSCAWALYQAAEKWYASLTAPQKEIARLVLLKMVRVTDNLEVVGDRVRREDLYQSHKSPAEVNEVLDGLIAAHLVRMTCGAPPVPSGAERSPAADAKAEICRDDQFQLVHSSLWLDWEPFTVWLKGLREGLVMRQRLESLAVNWVILGRQDGGLLDKYQLHEARIWLKSPQAVELGYDPDLDSLVQKSERLILREKRVKRRYVYALIASGVLVLTGLILLVIAEQKSLRQATSRRLAEKANDLHKSQLDLALLLSLEAHQKDKTSPEAQNSLLRGLAYSPRVRAFLQPPGRALELRFSPDGERLSALTINGGTSLWEVKTLRLLNQQLGTVADSDQEESELSADGSRLLSIQSHKLALKSLDLDGTTSTIPISVSGQLTSSHDGKRLVMVTPIKSDSPDLDSAQHKLTLWDVVANKEIQSVLIEESADEIAFSPEDKTLATASLEGRNVVLYRASDLKQLGKPIPARLQIYKFEFSGDGKTLAWFDMDGKVILWNLENQTKLGVIDLNAGMPVEGSTSVSSFALSRNGKELVVGYSDGTVAFWNVLPATLEDSFSREHGSRVTNIAFRDGDTEEVITTARGADTKSILLWTRNLKNQAWNDVELPIGRSGGVSDLALSPDSRTAAVISDDGAIIVWDLQGPRLGEVIAAPQHGPIAAQAFTADGTRLLVRDLFDEVNSFDMATKKLVATYSLTKNRVADAAFSKDGRILAVRDLNNEFSVWDTVSGRVRECCSADKTERGGEFGAIAINHDGSRLAWIDQNGMVFWDLNASKEISRAKQESPACLAFNSNGTKVISGTRDGRIAIWNVADGKKLLERERDTKDPSAILRVGFSANGSKLIAATEDGTLLVWDEQLKLLARANLNITSFVLRPGNRFDNRPDDQTLACVRNDGRVTFWDLTAQEEIGTFLLGRPVTILAYSPDGNTLVAGLENGDLLKINFGIEGWKNRACEIANRNLSSFEIRKYRVLEDQAWRNWLQFWKSPDSFYRNICTVGPAG